jgi:hypothetical protein
MSLLSFLLLVSLVCVVVSHFRLNQENRELKQENDRLMSEAGYVVVHDANKIYLRKVESLDELTWRYRVYLPPQKTYLLSVKAGRGGGGAGTIRPMQDQFTLTVAVRRDSRGKWAVIITMPKSSFRTGANDEVAEKLADRRIPTNLQEDQKELTPDKPFDLVGRVTSEFHVWIEPFVEPM